LLESYRSLMGSQGEENPRALMAKQRLEALYQAMNKPGLAARYRD